MVLNSLTENYFGENTNVKITNEKHVLGEKYANYPVLCLLSHMHISKVYISHDDISFYSYHPVIRNIIYASIKIQMTANIHQHVKTCVWS